MQLNKVEIFVGMNFVKKNLVLFRQEIFQRIFKFYEFKENQNKLSDWLKLKQVFVENNCLDFSY